MTASGGGAVTTSEITATVRAAVLPALLAREKSTESLAACGAADPDSLEFSGPAARIGSAGATLSAGRPASVSVSITL